MDYITYEGLRLTVLGIIITSCFGLHYLWGIETFVQLDLWFFHCWNGLHYLWGIETFSYVQLFPFLLLDYITYEGLRLNWMFISTWFFNFGLITLPMRDWDGMFFLVIKEILVSRITLPMRDWDGYVTRWKIWKIRITLPMRDWDHMLTVYRYIEVIWILGLHYLWGIETLFILKISTPNIIKGLHYLWGIETFLFSWRWSICRIGLHYLWGIETRSFYILYNLVYFQMGLHYLWGIETLFPVFRH